MTAIIRRTTRRLAPLCVALGLLLGPVATHPVRAQPDPTATTAGTEEGGGGRPLDGYLATITLMLLAMWVVCRSARR